MDVDTLLERFEREYQEPNSITTPRRQAQAVFLRQLAASLDHPLSQVTVSEAVAFIGSEITRGIHPNTGRKHVGMLHSFARWGEATGALDHGAELRLIRRPRGSTGKSQPAPYTMAEITTMKKAIARRWPLLPAVGPGSQMLSRWCQGLTARKQMPARLTRYCRRLQVDAQVALALELGLRRIEIHTLTIASAHYDNRSVIVLTAKQGPGVTPIRAVPYTQHARQVMQDWLEFRQMVVPEADTTSPWLKLRVGAPLSEQIEPAPAALLKNTLPSPWIWRRLRHTAATEWLRAKVPLEKVRIYMGHSTIEQTLAYTEILNSDIEADFQEAEARFAARLRLVA
jgi:integrase